MIRKALLKPEAFQIAVPISKATSFGCNQEWYPIQWQKDAGCGPTVATNILLYMDAQSKRPFHKQECLELMESVWKFITPTNKGVNTLELFYQGMSAYANSQGMKLCYSFCNITRQTIARSKLINVIKFLEEGLDKNVPVAFLNLDSGDEKAIEGWHWVTVIGLEYTGIGEEPVIEILDNGTFKRINLALWYKTTIIGGGFVYFTKC